MTYWQVTYPNTPRENIITRGLFPVLMVGTLIVLAIEAMRSGPARKVT